MSLTRLPRPQGVTSSSLKFVVQEWKKDYDAFKHFKVCISNVWPSVELMLVLTVQHTVRRLIHTYLDRGKPRTAQASSNWTKFHESVRMIYF